MHAGSPLTENLLQVRDLTVTYPAGRGRAIHAVNGVSLHIAHGETLGLVGESGCGKSSLARAIMHLPGPSAGEVVFNGVDLAALGKEELRRMRSRFQMIFQDPSASLNPMRRAGESIAAPLAAEVGLGGAERKRRSCELMAAVGLDPDRYFERRPFQMSGGECQRVSIARALVRKPQLLVCDEPVSSLDVSVQAQILNLLREVKREYSLSMLFISHDLAVVKNISDRVAVMYSGFICEIAPSDVIFAAPFHPYTKALLRSVRNPPLPIPPPPGEGAISSPGGCPFMVRCPRADCLCAKLCPELHEVAPGHMVACHFPVCLPLPGLP